MRYKNNSICISFYCDDSVVAHALLLLTPLNVCVSGGGGGGWVALFKVTNLLCASSFQFCNHPAEKEGTSCFTYSDATCHI